MSRTVHLIYWSNGKGLEHDARVLTWIAEKAGFKVTVSNTLRPGHFGSLWKDHVATRWHNWRLDRRLTRHAQIMLAHQWRLPYDVAICIEDFFPAALQIARKTALIPNQEWFSKSDLSLAKRSDIVLCKSKLAESIFLAAGTKAYYTGFSTLIESGERTYPPDYTRCLHVAGRSFMKGTPNVIEAWRRHPEWPPITLLGTGGLHFGELPHNVHVIDHHVSEARKATLQATHGIHLCPSESEGYGHTIAEGMAHGALVVTTNAPPMNELISPGWGFLIEPATRKPKGLDYSYSTTTESIEKKMLEVWSTPVAKRAALGNEAKRQFKQSQELFCSSFISVLEQLTTSAHE